MEDYKWRLVSELQELVKKRDKLSSFINNEKFLLLDESYQSLLLRQLEYMGLYVAVLIDRVEALGIDLFSTLRDAPVSPIMKYFKFDHLPEKLQGVSGEVYTLACSMDTLLPDGPEKSAGLRKLLEAKDCFVRASL